MEIKDARPLQSFIAEDPPQMPHVSSPAVLALNPSMPILMQL
jgi:hypothetical protein